ncbi:MAG: hypothetical protein R2711_19385 [Acidimicrobiales bacterium]
MRVSSAQYRNPFTGERRILNGEVTGLRRPPRPVPLVVRRRRARNQDDAVLAKATVEVLLPSEAQLANGAVRDGQMLGAVR